MDEVVVTGYEDFTDTPIAAQDIELNLKRLLSTPGAKRKEYGRYASIEGVMRNVLRHMVKNPEREKKYKRFIARMFQVPMLWQVAGLPHHKERQEGFILAYTYPRLVDEIGDGDTPEKIPPEKRIPYLKKRLKNLEDGTLDPKDQADALAIRILSDIAAIDPLYVHAARQRLAQILGSVIFDVERAAVRKGNTWKLCSRKELEEHFYTLDIEGVVGLSLFFFGFKDSPYNMSMLAPLGRASRTSYNIRDFSKDIREGLCNIPKEDFETFGMTYDDLQKAAEAESPAGFPEKVTDWLRKEALRGYELLQEYKDQRITTLGLSDEPATRNLKIRTTVIYKGTVMPMVFYGAYYASAEKTFSDTRTAIPETFR